jgi:ATP phosphoribosyltransferase regulatory subunit
MKPSLLPVGIYDNLPPESAFEAKVVARLLKNFGAHGYEAVSPPLIEFEETLEKGVGKNVAKSMFRVMDPLSHKMMGVRADITPQIVRIAETRMKTAPRPLRLAYAGPVLRVEGEGLKARRQWMQAGLEIIGSEAIAADVEIVRVAASTLMNAKVTKLSADFSLPLLLPIILGELAGNAKITKAIAQKNLAPVRTLAGKAAPIVEALMQAAGPADDVLKSLKKLKVPKEAAQHIERLEAVLTALKKTLPELSLTIDVLENHGFDYHAGISFVLYTAARGGVELARGGRYYTSLKTKKKGGTGDAVGCTIAVDDLLSAIPRFKQKPRVLLPLNAPETLRASLIKDKYIVVQALEAASSLKLEAKRLKCTYYIDSNQLKKV